MPARIAPIAAQSGRQGRTQANGSGSEGSCRRVLALPLIGLFGLPRATCREATELLREENYRLNIDTDGNLPLYEYGTGELLGETGPEIQWTLTGWQQTILAGDIVVEGDTTLLRVLPTATYRPFPNDPPVNDVEVFDGLIDCEVLAYTFQGAAGDIGLGSVLGVRLVPEPGTAVMLLVGVVALALRRRRA